MSRKNLLDRIDESLEKSIIFMGPMAVGKTLVSRKLAEKLGYTYFSLDHCLQYIARLSKEPESQYEVTFRNYFAEYLDTFYKVHNEYDRALFNKDLMSHFNFAKSKDNDIPETLSMMIEQAYNLRILQIAVKCIMRNTFEDSIPLVIDAGVLTGLNIDCTQIQEGISDENLERNFGFTRKSLNEFIQEQLMLIGERVLLVPGSDYEKVAASCINNPGNQVVLQNLEGMHDIATIVSTVDGVFYNLDNSMFKKDRREVPLAEKQSKINQSALDNIVDQIAELLEQKKPKKELS